LKEAVSREDNVEIIDMLVAAGAYFKEESMGHVEFKPPYQFDEEAEWGTAPNYKRSIPHQDRSSLSVPRPGRSELEELIFP